MCTYRTAAFAEQAHTSIRFGIGRFSTEEEVQYAIQVLTPARLRAAAIAAFAGVSPRRP